MISFGASCETTGEERYLLAVDRPTNWTKLVIRAGTMAVAWTLQIKRFLPMDDANCGIPKQKRTVKASMSTINTLVQRRPLGKEPGHPRVWPDRKERGTLAIEED